jgi:hypothetical protein
MATARGWITQEGWTILSEQLLQIAGPAITIAGLVWSYFDKTDAAIVAKAIALPEVAKIECCDTPEGVALAESVPHEDVVAEEVPAVMVSQRAGLRRVVQAYPKTK